MTVNVEVGILLKLLRYDAETGKLFWLERGPEWFKTDTLGRDATHGMRSWNSKHSGKEALTSINSHGYHNGSILGVHSLAHRVIWAMQTGAWPKEHIDHSNGETADNRFKNLREATPSQNSCNRRTPVHNALAVKGVDRLADGRFRAQIKLGGVNHHLGLHASLDDAKAAYASASLNLHGEFGRVA